MRKFNSLFVLAGLCVTLACAAAVRPDAEAGAAPSPSSSVKDLKGTLVVVNPLKSVATLIDVASMRPVKEVKTGQGPHEAAASVDGTLIAVTNYAGKSGKGNTLTLISLPDGEVVKTVNLGRYGGPHGIAWLDNERVIYTSEDTMSLVVFNVISDKLERVLETGHPGSHMLAVTADRKKAFSANIGAGNITAFDLTTGKKLGDVATGDKTEGIAVTPDGRYVWGGNLTGSVAVVDTRSMQAIKTHPAKGLPIRLAATTDGKHILVSQPMSGDVVAFDSAGNGEAFRIKVRGGAIDVPAPADPVTLLPHPGGRYVFAGLYKAGSVCVIDLESKRTVAQVQVEPIADGLAYSPITVRPV